MKEATKMFRTLTAISALAALLATAACNDVTGPMANSESKTVSGGGHRTPQQQNGSEVVVPEEPIGGAPGDIGGINAKRLGTHRGRNEFEPGDSQGGGGGEATGPIQSSRGRRGRGDVTPNP
jgi:hypothetical protein